jgi:hypothetical protein
VQARAFARTREGGGLVRKYHPPAIITRRVLDASVERFTSEAATRALPRRTPRGRLLPLCSRFSLTVDYITLIKRGGTRRFVFVKDRAFGVVRGALFHSGNRRGGKRVPTLGNKIER